jgi:anthranilate phosphoribosyltransferase
MEISLAIEQLVTNQNLTADQMHDLVQQMMSGHCTAAQIAGFLVALRMKGENSEELLGAAQALRALATPLDIDKTHLVDTCGTGGDGSNIFNVSTAAAFVVAAAGGRVAKHGNYSVSSHSGSANLLEAAGVNLTLTPHQAIQAINQLGIGFLFAPHYHQALKYAAAPRRELGIRTFFNLLGPVINPAQVPYQVMGVFSAAWQQPLAEVFKQLGSRHVLIIHADDGLDEISLAAPTQVIELKNGKIDQYSITPEQFGRQRRDLTPLKITQVQQSLALVKEALAGQPGAAFDIVSLNAGAAIYAANLTANLADGIARAEQVMASGEALQTFQRYRDYSVSVRQS